MTTTATTAIRMVYTCWSLSNAGTRGQGEAAGPADPTGQREHQGGGEEEDGGHHAGEYGAGVEEP